MKDETQNLLLDKLVVINVGVSGFADSFEQQEVEVIHVDWVPPAGGDEEMIDLLDELL
jgi:FdrA protein